MDNSVKRLTRCALLIALGCALLYFSAVIPSGRVAVIAIAGILTSVALINCGMYYSIAVFAVTSILGVLIVPLKSCGIIYASFLGYYPIIKSILERIRNRKIEWILKIIVFNLAFTLMLFLGKGIFLPGELPAIFGKFLVLGYLLMNAVFLIYDQGLSKLISFYIIRVSKYIDK